MGTEADACLVGDPKRAVYSGRLIESSSLSGSCLPLSLAPTQMLDLLAGTESSRVAWNSVGSALCAMQSVWYSMNLCCVISILSRRSFQATCNS
jgi:hypothetical protein